MMKLITRSQVPVWDQELFPTKKMEKSSPVREAIILAP